MSYADNPYRSPMDTFAAHAAADERSGFITKTYMHLAGAIGLAGCGSRCAADGQPAANDRARRPCHIRDGVKTSHSRKVGEGGETDARATLGNPGCFS